MTVDGLAAAATLRGFAPLSMHGYCLMYVWRAYAAHGATADITVPTALAAWQASSGQHPGDRNPPPGVPVFWGARPGSDAGDIVISLGGGRVVCTDYPSWGEVGECSLDEREAQIGRPYLGWTETILGYPISYPGTAASASATRPHHPRRRNPMEAVVVAPNKQVVHLAGGANYTFGSEGEYWKFREQLATLAKSGATHNIMPLPELGQVPHVDWATYEALCKLIGAPTKDHGVPTE